MEHDSASVAGAQPHDNQCDHRFNTPQEQGNEHDSMSMTRSAYAFSYYACHPHGRESVRQCWFGGLIFVTTLHTYTLRTCQLQLVDNKI